MTEETESQQQDTYLLKLRRRCLFQGASGTMTIAESLRELGVSGYVRRLQAETEEGWLPALAICRPS